MALQANKEFSSKVHEFLRQNLAVADFDTEAFAKGQNEFILLWSRVDPENFAVTSSVARNYNIHASIDERAASAYCLALCWTMIRYEGFKTEYEVTEIDCTELTVSEFGSLVHVYDHCRKKINNAPKFSVTTKDFIDSVLANFEEMSELGMKVDLSSHRRSADGISLAQRLLASARQNKREAEVMAILESIDSGKSDDWRKPIENESAKKVNTLPFANLFQIDYLAVWAMKMRAAGMNLREAIQFIRLMCAFSFSKQVDRPAQQKFWHSEYVAPLIHHLRDFMHERFEGLHENPFYLSFLRAMRANAALYPTSNAMSILYIKDQTEKLRTLAKLCKLYIANDQLSDLGDPNSTTEVEHLVHQVLVQGAQPDQWMNKNFCEGSAFFKVKFVYRKPTGSEVGPPAIRGGSWELVPTGKSYIRTPVRAMKKIKEDETWSHKSISRFNEEIVAILVELCCYCEGIVKTVSPRMKQILDGTFDYNSYSIPKDIAEILKGVTVEFFDFCKDEVKSKDLFIVSEKMNGYLCTSEYTLDNVACSVPSNSDLQPEHEEESYVDEEADGIEILDQIVKKMKDDSAKSEGTASETASVKTPKTKKSDDRPSTSKSSGKKK